MKGVVRTEMKPRRNYLLRVRDKHVGVLIPRVTGPYQEGNTLLRWILFQEKVYPDPVVGPLKGILGRDDDSCIPYGVLSVGLGPCVTNGDGSTDKRSDL